MACFKPLKAYEIGRSTSGKKILTFKKENAPASALKLNLPCGQCIGCKLDRSLMWATRCVHEASLHDENCFITLTYNDQNLPPDRSLKKSDFQKFMKRLRKRFQPKTIRYYMCGEYGDEQNRPHYHACLFGLDFPDKEVWSVRDNIPLYTSRLLDNIWGRGFSTIGDVTFETAAYTARYVTKKINGDRAKRLNPETGLSHYERVHLFTGEILEVIPEYTCMSRRPGIASDWLNNYASDVYPHGYVVINGHKTRPPRYYDNAFEIIDPDRMQQLKDERVNQMAKHKKDNTPARLEQREKVKLAQFNQLKRNL